MDLPSPKRALFSGILAWLLLPWLTKAASFSAPGQFGSRIWGMEQGLPRTGVQAIAQTADGFLWVGTQTGLFRFDGDQFEPVSLNTNPRSQWISALCAARDGSLWIASADSAFHLAGEKLTHHIMPKANDTNVLSLREDADGSIWCGTRLGLARGENGTFVSMGDTSSNSPTATVNSFSPEKRIATYTIRSMTSDPQGNLWVGVPGTLIALQNGRVVTNYDISSVNADLFVRAICRDRKGNLWLGSNLGLTRWSNGKLTQFSRATGLPDNTVTSVYEDRSGNLWVGTYGGLCRYANGTFVIETTEEGEPYDQIYCFYEDAENNLWVGSKDGLCRLNPRLFHTYTTRHGLAHNNVISVYEDAATNLWIGTWGGGLHRIKDGQLTIYSTATTQVLRNDFILALCGGADGSLWFGADYDGGLYRWRDGTVQRFAQEQGVPHNALRAIWRQANDQLIIGTATGGLVVHKEKRLAAHGVRNGLRNNAVRCFAESTNGVIWVGTEGGLTRWQGNSFTQFTTTNGLSDDKILALHLDKEGALWIGTERGGLNRMKDGNIKAYTTKHGLFDDMILEIVEDDFDALWMTTFHGVFRVDKDKFLHFDAKTIPIITGTAYGKADGMVSPVCVGTAKPSAWKGHDGRIWFATTKGLAVADPRVKIPANEKAPPAVIKRILADKELLARRTSEPLGIITRLPSSVTLAAGRGELEIHYTALSFRAPEWNRFKYKLNGVDTDWVDAGTRRVAYYNNLAPGNYEFQVLGCNNHGVWNETGDRMTFTMLPHFWQTWWFKLSQGALGIFMVAGTAMLVSRKRMQIKLRRLEQQHAVERERARIAQDMHDEVGAKLTKITFLGGLVKNRIARPEEAEKEVDKIMHTARDLIGALDEIVWAVDPRNDTLDNFANYLCRHASEFFENSPIFCELNVPQDVPDLPLTADVRHNLFLALKETMNNALKHSGAGKVIVQMSVRAADFEIIISDDGRGFSSTSGAETSSSPRMKRKGNGLGNMRQRLESIGGKCEMQTVPGQGTRVSFIVPLAGQRRS